MNNALFTAALNGLSKISSGPDHTFAVVGGHFFKADLTHAQALELAAHLNSLPHDQQVAHYTLG